VVATGRRLVLERGRGRAVLEGDARLRNRDGVIQGDRMEGTDRLERVTVAGGVVGRFRDIDARSRTAEYDAREKMIIFIGDAEIAQAGRRLFSERVTVWYAAGRVVAEGATRIRIDPAP
jgi:lipopolysaccharide export system protein LptA